MNSTLLCIHITDVIKMHIDVKLYMLNDSTQFPVLPNFILFNRNSLNSCKYIHQ